VLAAQMDIYATSMSTLVNSLVVFHIAWGFSLSQPLPALRENGTACLMTFFSPHVNFFEDL